MHSYRRTHRKKRTRGIIQAKLRTDRTRETQKRAQAILDAIGEYQANHHTGSK